MVIERCRHQSRCLSLIALPIPSPVGAGEDADDVGVQDVAQRFAEEAERGPDGVVVDDRHLGVVSGVREGEDRRVLDPRCTVPAAPHRIEHPDHRASVIDAVHAAEVKVAAHHPESVSVTRRPPGRPRGAPFLVCA